MYLEVPGLGLHHHTILCITSDIQIRANGRDRHLFPTLPFLSIRQFRLAFWRHGMDLACGGGGCDRVEPWVGYSRAGPTRNDIMNLTTCMHVFSRLSYIVIMSSYPDRLILNCPVFAYRPVFWERGVRWSCSSPINSTHVHVHVHVLAFTLFHYKCYFFKNRSCVYVLYCVPMHGRK